MLKKKECIAMLLAGGQGSRLYALTENNAKPAVSFGGKYRIIDFPLSNCKNSGIDTVGVLTQYQPLELNEYIGNGQPWDLDRTFGGVTVLPPYQGKNGSDWYKGTANAIFQNITFIKRYDPEYVLILSGDHIYKMDYSDMLAYHKEKNAVCSVAVIDVPISEASRFGIMSVNDNGEIYEFEEKPKHPKSTKASMGIYIFNTDTLIKYLEYDNSDVNSENDFGKNIIPKLRSDKQPLYAYSFKGYWKDVGTLESLWEANMDLLGEDHRLNLHDDSWKILSRNNARPPHYIGNCAVVENSLLSEGCSIYGSVYNSIISCGVTIERGAIIKNSVISDDVTIKEDARINYSIIDRNTVIGKNATVGSEKDLNGKITVVGSECIVDDDINISSGEIISNVGRDEKK